ncbi:serine hydrolase domain-containing protein [Sorangium sp. So ce394]|uniref:serine hydrolase domain-containing protein n=1 Tax=Sorangium sp. So ce394 TaxID=3133310 RepID=UPI003F5CB6D9
MTSTQPMIQGSVAPGFERVRDAFVENLTRQGEAGASFCAYVDGVEVAHLWGGEARPGVPWTADTLACGAAVGIGVAALVAQRLADQGKLDVDAPVAAYWPEFAAEGKGAITVRMVLGHSAGLPWFPDPELRVRLDRPETLLDSEAILRLIEAAPPVWEPGTQCGYHTATYGWLVGEIVRRVTGKSLGTYLRDEIAGPLGAEYWIGLPEAEHHRVAWMSPDPITDTDQFYKFLNADTPPGKAMFMSPHRRFGDMIRDGMNHPTFWRAELASRNGVGTARGVARLYAMLASGGELDGVRVVSADSTARHIEVQYDGNDFIWGNPLRVGLGYMRPSASVGMGPHDEAFGHPGFGGAIGFADPVSRVGFAFLPNRMVLALTTDARAETLASALYACLKTSA